MILKNELAKFGVFFETFNSLTYLLYIVPHLKTDFLIDSYIIIHN